MYMYMAKCTYSTNHLMADKNVVDIVRSVHGNYFLYKDIGVR